jgi:hypothetical protein
MTLHVNRSTVGREAPLAPLTIDQDQEQAARPDRGAQPATADAGQDSAAISSQGQRLAALQENDPQLRAIAAAEELARSLAARIKQAPEQAQAAQGPVDPSRVASLLEG